VQLEFAEQSRRDEKSRDFKKVESLLKRMEALAKDIPDASGTRLAIARHKANLYFRTKRIGDLVRLARAVDKLDDGSVKTGVALAQIEGLAGLNEKAARRLKKLQAEHSESWVAAFAWAAAAKDEKDFDAALKVLGSMLEKSPANVRSARTMALADLLAGKGKQREADKLAVQSLEGPGAPAKSLAFRAYRYFKSNQADRARAILAALKKKLPDDDPNLHLLLGLEFRSENKIPEALAALGRANSLRPDWAVALCELADLKMVMAARDEREALKARVEAADVAKAARLVDSAKKTREECISLVRTALEADPAYLGAWLLLYRAARMTGEKAAAQEALEALTRKFPNHSAVLRVKLEELLRRNERARAAELLEKILAKGPSTAADMLQLAGLYEEMKKLAKAESIYDRLARTDYRYDPRVFAQMVAFWRRRRGPERKQALQKARAFVKELIDSGKLEKPSALADAHLAMARIHMSLADLDASMKSLGEAQKLVPDNPLPTLMLAGIYAAAGNRQKRIETLRKAVEMERKTGGRAARRQLAEALLASKEKKDREEAEALIGTLLEERKGDADALMLRVQSILVNSTPQSRRSDVRKAVEILRKTCEIAPRHEAVYVRLVDLQMAEGKSATAEETLEKGLKFLPGSTALRLRRADLLIAKGNSQRAAELLREGLEINPQSFELKRALARAVSVIEPKKAVSSLRELLRELTEDGLADARRVLLKRDLAALLAYRLHKPDEAEAELREAYRLSGESPVIWAQLMELLTRTGHLEKADKLFEARRNAAPNDIRIQLTYARLLVAGLNFKGYAERAVQLCGQVLEKDPENATALSLRGNALNHLGKNEEALADYRKAMRQRKTVSLSNNIAWLLRELNRNQQEALELSKFAVEKSPDNAECWDTRRAVLSWAGRKSEALQAARKAFELSRLPRHRLRYAEALADAGRKEDARAEARKIKGDAKTFESLSDDQKPITKARIAGRVGERCCSLENRRGSAGYFRRCYRQAESASAPASDFIASKVRGDIVPSRYTPRLNVIGALCVRQAPTKAASCSVE